jgi:uncharacterized protein YgiM (DUF1202 family)
MKLIKAMNMLLIGVSSTFVFTSSAGAVQAILCKTAENVVPNRSVFLAQSQGKTCVVQDPTGSALNVRKTPGGKEIVDRINNGTEVTAWEYSKDRKWVRITTDSTIEGWVFAAYLKCQ